jgi:hypothetical protein
MHVLDEVAMDGGALLSGQVQPVKHGIRFTVFDPADSPQAVTFDEHRHDVQEDRAWSAQCFKERALVGTESALTGGAAQTSCCIAVNFDVTRADLPVVGAKGVVTPLTCCFHGASFLPD